MPSIFPSLHSFISLSILPISVLLLYLSDFHVCKHKIHDIGTYINSIDVSVNYLIISPIICTNCLQPSLVSRVLYCVCVCVCVCKCVCVCVCICLCVCVCGCMHACGCVCVAVCMPVVCVCRVVNGTLGCNMSLPVTIMNI